MKKPSFNEYVCPGCAAKARDADDDLDYFLRQVEQHADRKELARRRRVGMPRHHTQAEFVVAAHAQDSACKVGLFFLGACSWFALLGRKRQDAVLAVRDAMRTMTCWQRFRWWKVVPAVRVRRRKTG